MNSLYRELAPIPERVWKTIETEAGQALKKTLAARKLVEFDGPHGWSASSLDTGRPTELEDSPLETVEARQRCVQSFVEFRRPFEVMRREVEAIDRGAADTNLGSVTAAAQDIALAEDTTVLYGFERGGIEGIGEVAAERALPLTEDYRDYPDVVAEALNQLRLDSVDGPYAILLSPRCHTGLMQTRDAGYPVMEHVRRLLEGPIVWAPAARGAFLLSLRGGDFQLSVGQDFSIGYLSHTEEMVNLYIQESLAFRINTPEAAVPLRYETNAG
jgi:uncharacterized linocin/CFP29 family protein